MEFFRNNLKVILLAVFVVTNLVGCYDVHSDSPPPNSPTSTWTCKAPAEPTEKEIKAWCETNKNRGAPAPVFSTPPGQLSDLTAYANYNAELKDWLDSGAYSRPIGKGEGGWVRDPGWRMGGPVVGRMINGGLDLDEYYGTHMPMRIYYSPEIVDWLCDGSTGDIPDGAMVIKQQASAYPGGITNPANGEAWSLPVALNTDSEGHDDCMEIDSDVQHTFSTNSKATSPCSVDDETCVLTTGDILAAQNWQVVMVRANDISKDGWFWVEDHNSLNDKTAVTNPDYLPPNVTMDQLAPTGNTNKVTGKSGSVTGKAITYPGSMHADYCVNCHASAEYKNTYSSMVNIMGRDAPYRFYQSHKSSKAAYKSVASGHMAPDSGNESEAKATDWHNFEFNAPLKSPDSEFTDFYTQLTPLSDEKAWEMRFPAQTYDHKFSEAGSPGGFVTSDQCQGCHDASVSNSATPNMIFPSSKGYNVNLSPYATWSVSPMGMAGRDPIFYSQLRSELNFFASTKNKNSQKNLAECLQNTCLHCHGVTGQRQMAIDTHATYAGDNCKDIFPVEPPPGVVFGKPFSIADTQHWQNTETDPHQAKYGALARDGITCTVCHRIAEKDAKGGDYLGTEAGFTGNWVADAPDVINGPYKDNTIITKPMENSLGMTPRHADQITDSDLCESCHNVLLPIFNNDGTPNIQGASYEQTTGLEWQNSVYSKKGSDEFMSCQNCHMTTDYEDKELSTYIANIQSTNDFAGQAGALPDKEITLTKRGGDASKNGKFARHTLSGLNIFLNQFTEQFPALLGVKQIDYMNSNPDTAPAQIHGREAMLSIARQDSAEISIDVLQMIEFPEFKSRLEKIRSDEKSNNGTGDQEFSSEVMAGSVVTGIAEVTNKAGHFLPSGVGFRRAFLEIAAFDKQGNKIWCSGCTDGLGLILDGPDGAPLPAELVIDNPKAYQPHYEFVFSEDQAQIYQEVIVDSAGDVTTSFMRRVKHLKDNRIRPEGL